MRHLFDILSLVVLVCAAVALVGGVVLLIAGPRGDGVVAVVAASLLFVGRLMFRRNRRWLDELFANRS